MGNAFDQFDSDGGAAKPNAFDKFDKAEKTAAPADGQSAAGDFVKGLGRGLAGFVGDVGEAVTGKNVREAMSVQEPPAGTTKRADYFKSKLTPSYGEQISEAAGIERTPKTGFAGTAGEFLGNPASYVGPGSLPAKALTALTASVGSEAGGELTKGTALETPARIAGAVIGGKVPAGAARAVTPIPMTSERQAAVQVLRNEGIDAETAGQTTGSKAVQYWENHLGDAPGAGGGATASRDAVGRQFTAAALQRAGIQSDVATPQVIDAAFHRIGNQMDALAARNNAHMDQQFLNEMQVARDEYEATVQQGSRRAVVENVIDDFNDRLQNSPVLTGEQYQRFRSRLTRLQRGAADDPEYSQVLGDYVEAMDGMMGRSISNPADMAAWQEARRQYRNLIPLARASTGGGEQAAEGVITPARLRQVITGSQRGNRDYARGRGEFAELTRAGNVILTPLPNSGTAQREMARAITAAGGGAAGMLLGGATEAAGGLMAGAAAPGLVGRGLMSPLTQDYLRNQVAPNLPGTVPSPALRSGLVAGQESPMDTSRSSPLAQ
jgi:hypothetical protein